MRISIKISNPIVMVCVMLPCTKSIFFWFTWCIAFQNSRCIVCSEYYFRVLNNRWILKMNRKDYLNLPLGHIHMSNRNTLTRKKITFYSTFVVFEFVMNRLWYIFEMKMVKHLPNFKEKSKTESGKSLIKWQDQDHKLKHIK